MSVDIDWSKAPEWTIGHALYAFGGEIYEAWVGEFQYQRLDQPRPFPYGDVGIGGAQHNPRRSWFKCATPRPEAWNGEGLPPVETVCEMHRETYFEIDWQPVTLLCVGQAKAFFRDKEGHEWSRPLRELSFRPIRTPEQIAKRERSNSCDKMYGVILDKVPQERRNNGSDICEALYDAGYRKKPTTKFAEGEREELINHVFKSFNVKLSEAVAIVDGGYRKPTDQ